jgi:N-acetyl-alpha-D-muramate 1-phosphate uridylyltransferase
MKKPTPPRPKRAMVLAAGIGKRMRPLTVTVPKPLIEVAGRALVDHSLDRLERAGVETAVVNVHYLADLVRAHLARRKRPTIAISDERTELLDTGGGIAKALPLLGPDPFYVINAKIIWRGGQGEALLRLAQLWDDSKMDGLLLLQPTVSAVGYDGVGDFQMDQLGRISWRPSRAVAPFVYASIHILHPRLFAGAAAGAFPLRTLWSQAIEAGRLYGLRHDGEWYHVSTVPALAEAEARLGYTVASVA